MRYVLRTIFYIMLYLRKPFMMIAKLLSVLMVIGGIGILVLGGPTKVGIGSLIFSFATFMLRQFYDQILSKLSPPGYTLILDI